MSRIAGAASELGCAGMIEDWFEDAGYSADLQPFTYRRNGKTRYSQNIVAMLPATTGAAPRPLVIVGAHYDSVVAGNGADDNASGVAAMLEIAKDTADYERDYDVMSIAFGAEEAGLHGSEHYVGQMSRADKDRTVVMVNFDSLAVGDIMLHPRGGERDDRTARRDARDRRRPRPGDRDAARAQPALPGGAFRLTNSATTGISTPRIPVVVFEATNWEIGNLDGYTQTAKYGSFWHTGKDKLRTIEKRYPGRPLAHLAAYTRLVETYLEDPTP